LKNISKDNEVSVKKKHKYADGHWQLTGMTIPAILYVFLFCYIPMIGIIVAFKNYKYNLGFFGSPWNGIDNFIYLFKSNTLFNLVRNTLGYNIVFIVLGIVIQVFLALMLFSISNKWSIKLLQSSMFIPNFLSWVVVGYISHAFFKLEGGFINTILTNAGLDKISFYTEPKYWPLILTFFNLWKNMGFGMLMYYGSMLSIDSELYEAGELDGCGYWKKHIHITLPHLTKTIVTLTILNLGGIFRSDYGMFFYIPKDTGVLYQVTDVLDTYILRAVRLSGSVSQASAVGFLQSIVGFVTVISANAIVKKIDEESSLF